MTSACFGHLAIGAIFVHDGAEYEKTTRSRAQACGTCVGRNFQRFDNVQTLPTFID